jgi:hypothetical protein
MYSKSQFFALEIMSHERAAVARKEMEYWLAEAEEWARIRLACDCEDGSLTGSPDLAHLAPSKR